MGPPLRVPERYSSLLRARSRDEIHEIRQRQVSGASSISNSSTVSEIIDMKIQHATLEKECNTAFERGLKEVQGMIDAEQAKRARDDLDEADLSNNNQIVVLKRQRKLIEDDMEEELAKHHGKFDLEEVEKTYNSIMTRAVMRASGSQKRKERKHDQKRFRIDVQRQYLAKKIIDNGNIFHYCVLTGWHFFGNQNVRIDRENEMEQSPTKAAHLVPESMDSVDLANLFGVEDGSFANEPDNALPLHTAIAAYMNAGAIVFVPRLPATQGPKDDPSNIKWVCVVVNKNVLNRIAFGTFDHLIRWKDLDGRELVFLNENRPKRRYLFFRYVITYLHHKRAGNAKLADEMTSKGNIWATPGPYLRRAMLKVLAKEAGDVTLPEFFYETGTFPEGGPNMTNIDAETGGIALATMMKKMERREKEEEEGSDNEDSDEDEDEDEDE